MLNSSFFYWNVSREFFNLKIPLINRPIYWYGVLFAFGFSLAYLMFRYLLECKSQLSSCIKIPLKQLIESLTFWSVIGVVIGARFVDVFFYQDLSDYRQDFFSIFYAWEGGLASHGGVLGLLIVFFFFLRKKSNLARWILLDSLLIPALILATFIRIGNFLNQEILGTITTVPWAVTFAFPLDYSTPVPRHPVQIYEALFYAVFAMYAYFLIRKNRLKIGEGILFSVGLVIVFIFRFAIEFFKEEQSILVSLPITMGQVLSIPFIVLGLAIILNRLKVAPILHKAGRDSR